MPVWLDLSVFWNNWTLIVSGAEVALLLGATSVVVSLIFGLVGWALKTSKARPLRWLGNTYVEGMRNTPTLLYLYLIYFGLTEVSVVFSPFVSAVLALGVQGGAYMTEIIRGGFHAVSEDQRQAARALGLRPLASLIYVELPQMLRVAFPALGNQIVSLIVGTSLASVIAVPELTYQAQIIGESTYRYFSVFAVLAVFYVVIVQAINALWRAIERLWFGRWGATV
jgi:polar amino acid transport system permease protein